MKNVGLNFGKLSCLMFFFSAMTLFGSCQDLEQAKEIFLSLSDIDNLPVSDTVPLVGTRWRLLGFGKEGSERVRVAEPRDTDSQLWLEFFEDGKLEGFSSGNLLSGKYFYIPTNQFELLEFYVLSYAGESGDGLYMTRSLKNADMGKVESKGLKIFYSENDRRHYMLFRPLMP